MSKEPINYVQSDQGFMRLALDEAQNALPADVPVGAVIVKNGAVIAKACNRREAEYNPVGHAEILALQQAAKALGDWRLTDCTLYVTLEPCPMCASAIAQARVSRIVYGADDALAGACGSKYDLLMPGNGRTVLGGIQEAECQALLREFFNAKR